MYTLRRSKAAGWKQAHTTGQDDAERDIDLRRKREAGFYTNGNESEEDGENDMNDVKDLQRKR